MDAEDGKSVASLAIVPHQELKKETAFDSEPTICVPTVDTVRHDWLIEQLLLQGGHAHPLGHHGHPHPLHLLLGRHHLRRRHHRTARRHHHARPHRPARRRRGGGRPQLGGAHRPQPRERQQCLQPQPQ